jgi:Family of unknown function (DUF5946)
VFGLIGLYLHIEKQFSGHRVQQAHIELGRKRRDCPTVLLPENRGRMTVADVLAAKPGPERERAIEDWCRSVWTAFNGNRPMIVTLLQEYHII